jgi:hypothetical protein
MADCRRRNGFSLRFHHGSVKLPIHTRGSHAVTRYHRRHCTPLAVVLRARKTLRVSTTAGIAQIPAVSSKEGTVIGAVPCYYGHLSP